MPALAQDQSQARPAHNFFDRRELIDTSIHLGLRTVDAAQSCRQDFVEEWLPFQSCRSIAAYSLSMVPLQLGAGYLLHRLGHHRLERVLPYAFSAGAASGIGKSIAEGATYLKGPAPLAVAATPCPRC
ncbi:MAG TPA: hypothetical protein VE998_02005 [Terriglobales bacterium]|nr:hypothetical protein [Terriglobales bacterium]